MNILILNHRDWLNPRAGGVEEVLFQTATRWVASGHQVQLLTSDFTGSPARDLTEHGVQIHRRCREEYFNWLAPWLVRHSFRSADVIVEHFSKVACLVPWYTSQPVVGYAHHLFGSSLRGTIACPLAWYVEFMERLALRVYRRVRFLAVSESTAQDLTDGGVEPRQVAVVHNGVDHDLFQPAARGGRAAEPTIFWAGRLRQTKCVDQVVQAFAEVTRHVPQARLRIAGRGDFESQLRAMIQRLGLGDRVVLTGFLDLQQLRDEMQQAWVLAYPSSKEGWGLCVIEAAACGTPAVASDAPGLRDSVQDGQTGFLVEHGNIPALAERLRQILTDAPLRERLGTAALAWSREFTWDRTARESLAVIEQVCAQSPRP